MDQDTQPVNSPIIPGMQELLPGRMPKGAARKRLVACLKRIEKNPGHYDDRLIEEMKVCGIKRPDFIPEDAWVGRPKDLTPRETIIVYQASWGVKTEKIAQSLGCSNEFVNSTIKSELGQKQIRQIQHEIWGRDPRKWLQSLVPDAILTAKEIMEDRSVKPAIRLSAAQDFIDRGLGKAPQTIELESSNIRRVFEMLDKIGRAKQGLPVDTPEGEELIDAEFSLLDAEPDERDTVDQFIEETYGKESP